jgi:transcriptional regulator with XRE-family HTH domain
MTPEEIETLRKKLGLTQAQMAEAIGLGLRAYQDLASGKASIRPIHVKAAERAALDIAVERGDPMLAPATVRKAALRLAEIILEE